MVIVIVVLLKYSDNTNLICLNKVKIKNANFIC